MYQDDIDIIRNLFITSRSYGCRCRDKCLVNNTYIGSGRVIRATVMPIQVPVLKMMLNIIIRWNQK